ncbi:hypothetical protein [Streptomyces sp. NPDC050392]|uniref:hypothetical protein n=1 Tax=Streptomyces sp. NPDC050392 TaxID=3155782 RepID=UPI00342FA5CD
MTLNDDERQLLALFAQQPAPVDAFSLYRTLNLPPAGLSDGEGDPRHKAWTERQLELTKASLTLWQRALVRVAVPADGEHADQMEITAEGRTLLSADH